MKKKIGIGVSDFRKLRKNGLLFIDKSLLIQEVLQSGAEILLLPRPRRFGKTLNLTMLRYFFEQHETEEAKKDAESLFHGLLIRNTPEFEEHFAKYPVIYLTFKDVKALNFENALYMVRDAITREFRRHARNIALADDYDTAYYDRIAHASGTEQDYILSIQRLSQYLYEACGAPPVLLIDEYDTPLHSAWQNGYYDEMISFLRGLFSGALKDNPNIYKGIITGILRVAKESIFSDLNNLDIYTILEKPFSDRFGITEDEIKTLFAEYDMQDRLAEADDWYNGYSFGGRIIFNPWSILHFINRDPALPEPYWANTSSNELIKKLVINSGMDVRESVEQLIAGRTIQSIIDQNIVFPDLEKKKRYIYSLFFFSGYLKCLEQRQAAEQMECTLAIPNREVRYIFRNIIANWIEESFDNSKLTTMLRALVSGNIDQFSRLLNEFVITTLSFFDTKGRNPEAVYQAFVLGMLLNLGQEYEISSNRELGYGRYDILVMPRKTVKDRSAILMEMKGITGFYQEEPEKALQDAIKQIGRRAYARELEARGGENILRIVVVSDGKKVWVRRVD